MVNEELSRLTFTKVIIFTDHTAESNSPNWRNLAIVTCIVFVQFLSRYQEKIDRIKVFFYELFSHKAFLADIVVGLISRLVAFLAL